MSAGWQNTPPPKQSVALSLNLQANDFVSAVCDRLDVEVSEIIGRRKHTELSQLRQLLMHILHTDFGMFYAEIGRMMDRNHATVIFAVQQSDNRIETNQVDLRLRQYLETCEYVFRTQHGYSPKIFTKWHTTRK